MTYLDLFLGFLRVGLFSFGGAYAAIPLIREVVLSYGWMTDAELSNMIAISESTPGPIMINLATYVGSSQGGILGAFLATFAVVLPAFFIIILLMVVLKKAYENKYVKAVMDGFKSSIVGIILATGAFLIWGNVVSNSVIRWHSLVVTFVLAILLFGYKPVTKKNLSPFALIIVAAVLGIIIL